MTSLKQLLSIDNFSIESIDISDINELVEKLPRTGVLDLNIAENCLILTLEGQNLCQEKIVVIDRWIGKLESLKNKSWSNAALVKAKAAGYTTAKDKEWHAQADDEFNEVQNQLTLAKACKKWFENKAGYFSGWHYALKTFLRRDYGIENASGTAYRGVSADEPFPYEGKGEVLVDDGDIWG
jgi:hypothetical protein